MCYLCYKLHTKFCLTFGIYLLSILVATPLVQFFFFPSVCVYQASNWPSLWSLVFSAPSPLVPKIERSICCPQCCLIEPLMMKIWHCDSTDENPVLIPCSFPPKFKHLAEQRKLFTLWPLSASSLSLSPLICTLCSCNTKLLYRIIFCSLDASLFGSMPSLYDLYRILSFLSIRCSFCLNPSSFLPPLLFI